MSRELKFRVWDREAKRMSMPFSLFGEFTLIGGVHSWQRESGLNRDSIGALSDLVELQFTGLKDKNGIEVYEGDIIKVWDEEVRQVVFKNAFWQFEEFVAEGVLGGFGTPVESGHKPIYRYGEKGMEVIGNIYENIDLLTG